MTREHEKRGRPAAGLPRAGRSERLSAEGVDEEVVYRPYMSGRCTLISSNSSPVPCVRRMKFSRTRPGGTLGMHSRRRTGTRPCPWRCSGNTTCRRILPPYMCVRCSSTATVPTPCQPLRWNTRELRLPRESCACAISVDPEAHMGRVWLYCPDCTYIPGKCNFDA